MTMNSSLVVTLFLYWHRVPQTIHQGSSSQGLETARDIPARRSCLIVTTIRPRKLASAPGLSYLMERKTELESFLEDLIIKLIWTFIPGKSIWRLGLHDVGVRRRTPWQGRSRGVWRRRRSCSPDGNYVTWKLKTLESWNLKHPAQIFGLAGDLS